MENTQQSNVYDEKIKDGHINTMYYFTLIVENITNFLFSNYQNLKLKILLYYKLMKMNIK